MNFSWLALWAFTKAVLKAWAHDRPLHHHDVRQVVFRQVYFTGVQAFRLIVFFAAVIGIVTVAQSGSQLTKFGGSSAIGPILVAAIVRELGPLITVIVVVARSVSAIASELSAMKANGEIDGLRGIGVSPLSYLVVSRTVSGAVSTLLLAMHFVWIAFFVGFITSQVFIDMPWFKFIEHVTTSLTPIDLGIFFLKTFSLGSIVFLLACFCGLRITGASFEIPQATTKAVVWSFMFCFGVQMMISGAYYFYIFQRMGLTSFL